MKDAVICFRIGKDLRKVLEKISEVDRRSLSATIEHILYIYAEQRGIKIEEEEEKRRYPRKKITAPALVSGSDGVMHGGMVSDVSLGGLRVSVPEDYEWQIGEDSRISVVFALPESDRPLTMHCVPRHVRSDGRKSVGASFIHERCEGYEALSDHLAN